LKKTKPDTEEFAKIMQVFPDLLRMTTESEDMFLMLHGVTALKTFIHLGHKHVLKL